MNKIRILIIALLIMGGCSTTTHSTHQNFANRGLIVPHKNKEQRVALVVGNNNYKGRLSKLYNPINDARAIKDILEKRGFDVIYVEDSSKKTMKVSLDTFYRKIAKGGVGMFYFSGHGIEVEGQNYLIPTDAKIDAKSDTEYEAISLSKVTKRMQNSGNRLNIVVLDACRNDPFSRATGVGGLAKIEPIGMFVSFATGAGSVASDGKAGGNGLFTKSLIKYMKQEIDLRDVFQKTRKEVYQASNHKQFPAIYDQTINGKFYFTYPRSIPNTSQSSAFNNKLSTPPVQETNVSTVGKTATSKPINHKIYVSKVIITPSLQDKISIDNTTRNQNNMIEVVVDIDNKTTKNISLQYKVKWLNNEGFEVGEGMSIWQPLFVEAKESKKIREIAPTPMASSYRLYFK